MAQSYGSITVTDLTDITDVYLEYGLAVENASVNNNYSFSQTGEIGWSTTVPEWKIGYKIWRREATTKEGVGTTYSTPIEDTSLNGLQSRLRYMWTNLTPHTNGSGGWTKPDYPAGSYMASGGTGFDYENSGTYGFNLFMDNSSLKFRYNGFKLSELSGTALSFYSPSITSQGSELMNLSGLNGLTIKDTSGNTVANFNSTITLGKPYGPTDYNAAKLELTNKSLELLKNYIGTVFSINTDSSYTSVSGASKTHSTIMQIGASMDTDEEFISFARITPTDFGYYLTINSDVLQNYPIFTLDAINKQANFYDGKGHTISSFNDNGIKIYKDNIVIADFGTINDANHPTVTIGRVATDEYNLWMLPKGMYVRKENTLVHFLGDEGLFLNQYTTIKPGELRLADNVGRFFTELHSPGTKTITQTQIFNIEANTEKDEFVLDSAPSDFDITNVQFIIKNPEEGVDYVLTEEDQAVSGIAPEEFPTSSIKKRFVIDPPISGPNKITFIYNTTVPRVKCQFGYAKSDRLELTDEGLQLYKADDVSNSIVSLGFDNIRLGQLGTNYMQLNSNGLEVYKSNSKIASFGSTAIIGNESNLHIKITDSRLSFYRDGNNEVAYIDGNKLYITQSVVLQQMDVGTPVVDRGLGQWSWKVHEVNGANNLYLKWLG